MKGAGKEVKRVLLTLALLAAVAGCREEPVPVQELFTLRNQGLLHLERGQLEEAEAQFARLVELAPDEPLGHANLGLTLLRAGRTEEAESHLTRARRLDPGNVEVALILARLYVVTDRPDEARALLEEMGDSGSDVRLLYALAELDSAATDASGRARYLDRLRSILEIDAVNLPVRLRLAEALLEAGQTDDALRELEEIRRIPPEPPTEALPLLETALEEVRDGNIPAARDALSRFHQAVEVTAPYQAELVEMGWVEGPLVGNPVLTFAPEDFVAMLGMRDSAEAAGIAFVDATDGSGLPEAGGGAAVVAAADIDRDGRPELFVSPADDAPAALHRERGGQFLPLGGDFSLPLEQSATAVAFADLDNDGWLDLAATTGSGAVEFLRNRRDGSFEPGPWASIATSRGAQPVFVDVDHDGDLDLLLPTGRGVSLHRNNLDGTFTDVTREFGLAGAAAAVVDFGDLDGDGRIDLVLSGGEAGLRVYRNQGARGFSDATDAVGLDGGGSGPAVIADLDNDGILDLVITGGGESPPAFWRGERDGTFTRETRSDAGLSTLPADAAALRPLDFDNDGWLDLVAVSPQGAGSSSLVLLRNTGDAVLENKSAALPDGVEPGGRLLVVDIDGDGDLDLLLGQPSGGVRVLRNEGGNLNRAVRVELNALGAGSGKNNDFGIGALLQLRVGDTLQTRVVTEPVTHFGLGPHLKADVLRVEWPNGVPQLVYLPGTDQDVLELETLKGSCAFLYTWDGERFRFVTDVMWRSALGMPLGLMGQRGSTMFAPPGASREYLRLPGEALVPRDGHYVLQLTEELWETAYLDEVRLLAVDRPDSVEIFVDERFVPPGPVDLRIYALTGIAPPLSATDDHGNDLLAALRNKDDVYVDNLVPTRYQGIVDPHDLVLDLGEVAGEPGAVLVLRGWIYPTDASINVALSQQTQLVPQAPVLEVKNAAGEWVKAVDLSFPSGKDKTIVVELGGIFPTSDHRVRLHTNLQIYWDQAFVAREVPQAELHVQELPMAAADLHYRGFSRMYRKGGRYGPHWFDYQEVNEESPWRPITGAFTRFGDVLSLLTEADDKYVVMAPGDETTIEFETGPDTAGEGWQRDFLLYTVGWIKDSDLNTAFGDTVEPLPFHGIKEYPYAPGESYPDDPEHQRYLREYNTRIVTRR